MSASQSPENRGGCVGKVFGLVVLVLLAAVAFGVLAIFKAQDLTDLEGYGESDEAQGRNLKVVMEDALERGYTAKITEEDLNRYLRRTLAVEQQGALAGNVELKQVGIRLEEGRAEVVLERELFGRPFTVSMYLRIEQYEKPDGRIVTQIFRNGGSFHEKVSRPALGGRFGSLPVPEGFLHLVLPSFADLVGVYRRTKVEMEAGEPRRELDLIDEMSRIEIHEGELVLHALPESVSRPPAP
jgi:hypothetical protein